MKALMIVLLLSLAACKSVCPVKVQMVNVPIETMVPIRSELTSKPAKPKRPANQCHDAKGRQTMCNKALADWVNAYDALVDKLFGKLDQIQELQPKP